MSAVELEPVPEGDLAGRLEVLRFRSRSFENARWIRVLLPPGYDRPARARRRYPVLYLNDAQNLFDPATSFAGVTWRVAETVDALVASGEVPPMLVVGIDHGGKRRLREFVPWPTAEPQVRRPLGSRYAPFLVNELMPFVNERFRTRAGAASTGLGGSSLGAAIALHTAMVMPGTFERLLLESPSLFLGGGRLLKDAEACRRWPRRIALSVGTHEAANPRASANMLAHVQALERLLRSRGLGPERLRVHVEEGASHGETAWARRLPDTLRFLYGSRAVAEAHARATARS